MPIDWIRPSSNVSSETGEADGPIISAAAVEAHLAAVLDNLEAIPVKLELVQPFLAFWDDLTGDRHAQADELRSHALDVAVSVARVRAELLRFGPSRCQPTRRHTVSGQKRH
jgi:hypothetical protein